MNVITCLFKTSAFIYILGKNYVTLNIATPPLSQLIAIIAFDSHFRSSSLFLSFANILKKDIKRSLPCSPQLERTSVFQQSNIIPLKYRFPANKIPGLALVL